ncbi:MAG: hypothetical protein KDD40_04715 [Bdellovibrionales bacterium]|nr:hypothetical protein [Bdellovibrionales bacterium]
MEVVKKTAEYTIFKKRSGRYGVKAKNGKWVNAVEKVKILNKEGIIKAPVPKVDAPIVDNNNGASDVEKSAE